MYKYYVQHTLAHTVHGEEGLTKSRTPPFTSNPIVQPGVVKNMHIVIVVDSGKKNSDYRQVLSNPSLRGPLI